MGIRAVIDSWSFEKKGILFTFLAWFWQNWRVFDKKKITWERSVFERMDVFLTNYGHESNVSLRGWTFFDKIWAWKYWYFREKLEKKDILLTFLAHNIV